MTAHPPKPRLTVRVGITGHRPNKLDAASVPPTRQQLVDVFAAIEQAAAGIRKDAASFYTDAPPAFRLISGFAEGADQMAVAACPSGWPIDAIPPFPQGEYLKDFAASADDGRDVRAEFVGRRKRDSAVTHLPEPQTGMRDQGYANG